MYGISNNFATYLIAANGIQLSCWSWTKYRRARTALAFLFSGYLFYAHLSTSPNTISKEPNTAGTSANIWPFNK